jgi:hypothetical protein
VTLTRNTAGAAMSRAQVEARDKYVYRALLDRASNVSTDGRTLTIPDYMQPSGQHDGRIFGVSRRNVQRALAHLKLHGWVTWTLKPQGGEGRPPCHYVLLVGSDCDCGPSVKRQVKRQDGAQLGPGKAPGKAPDKHEFSASVKRQTAGQAAFSPKGKEGREGEGFPEAPGRHPHPGQQWPGTQPSGRLPLWEPGTNGADANPWPSARIPGVRGSPVPSDPDTRQALRVLVDALGPIEILEAK